MPNKSKASPDATMAVCSACHRDMPCGCPSGTELERLRTEVTSMRLLQRVERMLARSQEKVIAGLELRIEQLTTGKGEE